MATTIGYAAKRTLENRIGLKLSQVSELSVAQEATYVKGKTGIDLTFSKKIDQRKNGRGNPLLARKKIRTIDEINDKIDRLHR